MDKNTDTRSIDKSFAEAFKKDPLFKLYQDNPDELFLGIRDGYINLYHLCNSVAKISITRKGVRSEINPYFIDREEKNHYDSDTIVRMYETIKARSRERSKLEKQAQQTLAQLNNANPKSKWYCLDVEYEKSQMAGRFDLVAVSRKAPHRVALIELKYGSGAYGGTSGILTHVKDFKAFLENGNYEILKQDIEGIISGQKMLDVNMPKSVKNIKAGDLATVPEFYFITVNNRPEKKGAASPKQTMAGYLFKKDNPKYKEWNCRKHSAIAVEDTLGFDITEKRSPLYATLLFTEQNMGDLSIDDIIDGTYSERIQPHCFEDDEKKRYNDTLIGSKYLYGDVGNDKYYPNFRLLNAANNIFKPTLEKAMAYFSKNGNDVEWFKIAGWKEDGSSPTKHVLSSQVACINHLFPLRNDKDAVIDIARTIDSEISDVILLNNDREGTRGYISFEVVSQNDYLNEDFKHTGKLNRGEFCTSIDAIIIGVRNNKRVMLVVEWKYTESYVNIDKSKEDGNGNPMGSMKSGDTRLRCYSNLILHSATIRHPETMNLRGSVFFFEPFYQLMRQTLWAEQMIYHKDSETLKADDYIHVHVIPSANKDLLNKIYPVSGKMMEETWRDNIIDQKKYQIVTPEALLAGIDREKYNTLIDFLENRYWIGDKI